MDDVGRLLQGFLIIAAVSLIMGFFTLCGNSILGIADSRLGRLAEESKRGKIIKKLHDNNDAIIQTNLAVRTVVIMLMTYFGADLIAVPLHSIVYSRASQTSADAIFVITAALVFALAAILTSALCVNVPKRLCTSGKIGEKFAVSTFGIYRCYLILFKPMQAVFSLLSNAILRICGISGKDMEEQVTEEEILELLDAANENGGIEDEQAEMISNIFEFSDLEIHEVMTHRTEISAAEFNMPVAEAVRISIETGVSRIPVYKETIDDICGVIYIKDLLPLILDPDESDVPLSGYMHNIKYVPETSSCGELFRYFTENKKQIAVALDEYGGTAGIVTMEDLLECIVGNIRDEYDENEAEDIEEITPNTFDILGSADPDDVMERLGAHLDEEHGYDTMAGFITDLLGYIPEDGQTPNVHWNGITFGVVRAKDNRIEKIRAVKEHKKAVVMDEE